MASPRACETRASRVVRAGTVAALASRVPFGTLLRPAESRRSGPLGRRRDGSVRRLGVLLSELRGTRTGFRLVSFEPQDLDQQNLPLLGELTVRVEPAVTLEKAPRLASAG